MSTLDGVYNNRNSMRALKERKRELEADTAVLEADVARFLDGYYERTAASAEGTAAAPAAHFRRPFKYGDCNVHLKHRGKNARRTNVSEVLQLVRRTFGAENEERVRLQLDVLKRERYDGEDVIKIVSASSSAEGGRAPAPGRRSKRPRPIQLD